MVRRKFTYTAYNKIWNTGSKLYSQIKVQKVDDSCFDSFVNENSKSVKNNLKYGEDSFYSMNANYSIHKSHKMINIYEQNVKYANNKERKSTKINDTSKDNNLNAQKQQHKVHDNDSYDDYDESFIPPTKPRWEINSKKPVSFIKQSTTNSNQISIELQCICGSNLVKRVVSSKNDEWKGRIQCDNCQETIRQRSKSWQFITNKLECFAPWHGWYWHYYGTERNTLLRRPCEWKRLSSGYALCNKCVKKLYHVEYKHLSKIYNKKKLAELSSLVNLKT